jgi:hypothetical protein
VLIQKWLFLDERDQPSAVSEIQEKKRLADIR